RAANADGEPVAKPMGDRQPRATFGRGTPEDRAQTRFECFGQRSRSSQHSRFGGPFAPWLSGPRGIDSRPGSAGRRRRIFTRDGRGRISGWRTVNVLLFGATGMIGHGVLRECLLDTGVEREVTVVRRPTGQR